MEISRKTLFSFHSEVWQVFSGQVGFDSEVLEFLSVLKLGTCNVYRRCLAAFQQFYSNQGSIKRAHYVT
jgi:hypothetical protein